MKYKLRFFTYNAFSSSEQKCFASATSRHLPAIGDKVYLGDEMLVANLPVEVEVGTIYKVEDVVLVFNDYKRKDGDNLTSVEITLKAVP